MNRFDVIANVLANNGTIPSQSMALYFVLAKTLSRAYVGSQVSYLVGDTGTLWQEFTAQVRVFDAFAANTMAQIPVGGRLGTQIVALGLGTIS